MKADFNVHEGTFLLYPFRADVWRENAAPISSVILSLSGLIAEYEPVVLGVLPGLDKETIQNTCGQAKTHTMLYNDIWIRDSGAVPCDDRLVKFGFNAWGGEEGLYSDWSHDETIPQQMSELLEKSLTECSLILEGGNLLSNGKGTLVAIKATVCNENRNPNIELKMASKLLKQALGAEKVIWLDEGLVFDETGGHIDNLCAFADEKTILLAWTDDKTNPQYDVVHRTLSILESERGAREEKFNIIKVPLPRIFERTEKDCSGLELAPGSKERPLGEMIQPSYINFIFTNGPIIIPSFDDPADAEALSIFRKVFGNRRIIAFPAREIVLGGGGLHCITKNF